MSHLQKLETLLIKNSVAFNKKVNKRSITVDVANKTYDFTIEGAILGGYFSKNIKRGVK